MSEFRLPRLPRGVAIVDGSGLPTLEFQRWWQSVVSKIEVQEATQDGLLDEISDILGLTADLEAAVATVDAAVAEVNAAVEEVNVAVESVSTTLETVNETLTDLDTRVGALEN